MAAIPQIKAYGISDTGLNRSSNEDAYHIDILRNCFVVADGVGGAAAGEVASQLFVSAVSATLTSEYQYSQEQAVGAVKDIFLKANADIIWHATENPDHVGMACTAELLIFCTDGFILGHVGDSRTYRLREGELVRLTRDHSFVQQQLDLGNITEAEAQTHRYRNVILRAVGNEDSIDVDIIRGQMSSGDLFLQCSDGLTDMIGEDLIAKCLKDVCGLEEKARTLVAQANQAGGRDNITIVLATVGP